MADNCTTGDVRLAQNTTTNTYLEGRVEICINNAWGTICRDSYFDRFDAELICSMFGQFNDSEIIDSIGDCSGPIFIQKLDCSDEDTRLLECQRFSPLGLVDGDVCNHMNDVSLRCIGKQWSCNGETLCLIWFCLLFRTNRQK